MTEQPGEQREGDRRPDPIAAPVSSLQSWIVGDPRLWWPRESDVTRWLADHLDCLAPHLGVRHLEVIGREAVIGERWSTPGRYGIEQTVGGLRMDLAARDEHG